MNTKQNVTKNTQQTHVQVAELGKATTLTLGCPGGNGEGARQRIRFGQNGRTEITTLVVELGAATKLTLGFGGDNQEGGKRYFRMY